MIGVRVELRIHAICHVGEDVDPSMAPSKDREPDCDIEFKMISAGAHKPVAATSEMLRALAGSMLVDSADIVASRIAGEFDDEKTPAGD